MVRTKSKVRVSPKADARLFSLTGAKLLFFFQTYKHFLTFFYNLAEKCKYFGIYHIIMILKSPFLGIVSFNRKSYLCTQISDTTLYESIDNSQTSQIFVIR